MCSVCVNTSTCLAYQNVTVWAGSGIRITSIISPARTRNLDLPSQETGSVQYHGRDEATATAPPRASQGGGARGKFYAVWRHLEFANTLILSHFSKAVVGSGLSIDSGKWCLRSPFLPLSLLSLFYMRPLYAQSLFWWVSVVVGCALIGRT